jgi:UDPglucose 6-dehydrogenase
MKITIVGAGYVGLVTGACLAEMGNHVVCLDLDADKVRTLEGGGMPIHEPGLLEMVARNRQAGRLSFTTDVAAAVAHGTLQFIGVATPPGENGSADVQYVLAAARNIGRHMTDYKVVIDKSTVPVGTGERVKAVIAEELAQRGLKLDFAVVSNPEFLKEGAAINDFMRPDRVVIGADDDRAVHLMKALYSPYLRKQDRLLVMDIRSAEFTKYAANAMLASRISFMNELSQLAENLDVDIELVRAGIGSDPRIGYQFLYAGTGYGGSCFPKDVMALIAMGRESGVDLGVLQAVEDANARQKEVLVRKVVARFGEDLTGIRLAVWGLAFKPGTDDMREAPSRVIIEALAARGARIAAYDPVAMDEARKVLPNVKGLEFVPNQEAALEGSDALLIVTEWQEFKSPDFDKIRDTLKNPLIFDGRNLYDPQLMASLGIDYRGIGRKTVAPAAVEA